MNSSFYLSFNSDHTVWTEVESGRIGVLELHGTRGSLSIFALYLDPASNARKEASIIRLAPYVKPRHAVHSCVIGGSHFVNRIGD